jgi:hypothetical protein
MFNFFCGLQTIETLIRPPQLFKTSNLIHLLNAVSKLFLGHLLQGLVVVKVLSQVVMEALDLEEVVLDPCILMLPLLKHSTLILPPST